VPDAAAPSRPLPSGVLLIACSCLGFAAMAVAARALSGFASAPQVASIRFGTGAVGGLMVFLLRRQRPALHRPFGLALRGLLGGVAVLLYFTAIDRLGAGPATMLNYCSPCYAALFAYLFLKERPGPLLYLGLLIATGGAVMVVVGTGTLAHPLSPGVGAVAGVLSGVVGGAAMATVHTLRKDTDSLTVFVAFCVVGLLVCLPFALADWRPLSPELWLRGAVVGVLAMVGQLLFTWGMGFTTASTGSATTQLTVALSFVLELLVLGVAPAALSAAGAAVCLLGVLVSVVRPREARRLP